VDGKLVKLSLRTDFNLSIQFRAEETVRTHFNYQQLYYHCL